MDSYQIKQLMQSATNRLVAINVAVFFLVEALFAGERTGLELYAWNSVEFQFYQAFSYMFLHADFWHLAFNMLALWSFGRVLERVWGGQRFMLYFVLCGIGSAIIHILVLNWEIAAMYEQLLALGYSEGELVQILASGQYQTPLPEGVTKQMLSNFYFAPQTPAVGASGAVYGVLVAFAIMFPNFKIILVFLPIPIAAKFFVPVLLLIDLTAGLTGVSLLGKNIAHFAHLGGAITGFLLLQFWLKQKRS